MAKIVSSCIIALLCLLFIHGPDANVLADEAEVQVDHLNVRTGPGTHFDRVGQVNKTDKFEILQEKNNWLKVHWNGRDVWVAKWLTKVTQSEEASHETRYFSKVDYLRIRSAPGLHGKVNGYLMENESILVSQQEGSWLKIDKNNGWVHKDYVTKKKSQEVEEVEKEKPEVPSEIVGKIKVRTSILNVRTEGSTKGSIVTQVRAGQLFDYIDYQDRWYHIRLSDGRTGWVAGWLVDKVDSDPMPESKPVQKPTENTKRYVTLQYNSTNLRSGPSTNYNVVASGHKGNTFEVVGQQGQWYQIKVNGKTAFVAGWIVDEKGQTPSSPTLKGDLKGKTIMLDAGHGGKDSGAVGRGGSYEKTLTLNTAFQLKKQLESKGAKVLMARDVDDYVSLSIRSYYSNASNADAFISIHYNSAPLHVIAKGISSYYYHERDKSLAGSIQKEIVKTTGLRDRGVRFGNFHVIRENKKPAVLLELGFISDAREEQVIGSSAYQSKVSKGITQGLIHYFSK
ncbi:N-acetylmuramoyl-L-alanine amidase [Halobacillus locisalis]|uniref:N-acetylmuramoyl-L-alanine amidase n=1 Tax=Halobacillus locisalis TaxID=220753 RepID=A0A838CNS2_9BACI|nr:N-acetylmuramoyl-L-alanine amidase [Halobacillus locisalis]MBA2173489.1 N-acetylmuramoyl-L-alanine amidase [Halobacillus locisalis]